MVQPDIEDHHIVVDRHSTSIRLDIHPVWFFVVRYTDNSFDIDFRYPDTNHSVGRDLDIERDFEHMKSKERSTWIIAVLMARSIGTEHFAIIIAGA